ncbi:MAG: prefoldin subunit beta [Candidatus Sigynarchaeota archaeon]
MSQELPPDLQQKIRNFQVLQQNLQSLNEQKYSLEAQLKEIMSAKEYLDKAPADAKIFKSIGGLMVEATKEKAAADLKENDEILSTRVKKLDMTIEKTKAKYEEMKNDINTSLKNRMG